MRNLLIVLVPFGLVACSNPDSPPAPFPSRGEMDARVVAAKNEYAQATEALRQKVIEPYVAWTHEKPLRCTSPTLQDASDRLTALVSMVDSRHGGFETAIEGGTWMLDVADGAKSHGCKEFARGLYNKVMATFVGTGYAGLRDRAAVGLADIRGGKI